MRIQHKRSAKGKGFDVIVDGAHIATVPAKEIPLSMERIESLMAEAAEVKAKAADGKS